MYGALLHTRRYKKKVGVREEFLPPLTYINNFFKWVSLCSPNKINDEVRWKRNLPPITPISLYFF
jgi:hypothetical protein